LSPARGVVLTGPPPNTLVPPISQDALRAEIFAAMVNWAQELRDDSVPYQNRFYQGFIVLNYCRMLHDLRRGYPGSKREGTTWARSALDPAWSGLIDSAWDSRPDPARQVRQPVDPQVFERTLRFVAYVVEEGRRFIAER
jgi:acetyl esterase/lipase